MYVQYVVVVVEGRKEGFVFGDGVVDEGEVGRWEMCGEGNTGEERGAVWLGERWRRGEQCGDGGERVVEGPRGCGLFWC